MKPIKRKILLFFSLCLGLILISCNSKEKNQELQVIKDNPSLSTIIAYEDKKENGVLYNITDRKLNKIGKVEKISEFIYDSVNAIYIALVQREEQGTLSKNDIKVKYKEKISNLNKGYAALDLAVSKNEKYVAFRSFSKNTLDSAEGLRIYNIKEGKEVPFKTKRVISGNVYHWLNEEELLYYGVLPDGKDVSKIYKYSVENKKEEVFLEGIKGYCLYIYPIEEKGILYLERDTEESRLYYYDAINKRKVLLSNKIESVYKAVMDKNHTKIGFLASENNGSTDLLYYMDLTQKELKRINYDFPKSVDKNGGLAIDDNGNIYFCGTSIENTNNIFLYVAADKSVNLITNSSSKYKIYRMES